GHACDRARLVWALPEECWAPGGHGSSGPAGSVPGGREVLGNGGAGELLAEQTGKQQYRAAWPVARDNVLGLPGSVAGDENDTADGLAVDLSDVVLDPVVLAVRAG